MLYLYQVVLVRQPSLCLGISILGARSRSFLVSSGRLGKTSVPTKKSVSTAPHASGAMMMVANIKSVSFSGLYARYKLKPCKRSNAMGISGPDDNTILPERMIMRYTLKEEDRNSALIHHHL